MFSHRFFLAKSLGRRLIRVVGKEYSKIIELWSPVLDKEPFELQL